MRRAPQSRLPSRPREDAARQDRGGEGERRAKYHPPRLNAYGRLVELTLGGSPGTGDSGGGGLIQNPLI